MRKIYGFLFFALLLFSTAFSQTDQWTWVSGDITTNQPGIYNIANRPGIYGTKGVSSPNNKPGARYKATTWTDAAGNFWLFGGSGYAATTAFGSLNDLWKYDPATNQWTWVSGDNSVNVLSINGTIGVTSLTSKPGGRSHANGWSDANGNLWLFGGSSYRDGVRNDLWRYNIATNVWTWMSGDNFPGAGEIYGVKGFSSPQNKPGARYGAASWTDAAGNFWLFGGDGRGARNDLWKYDPATNQWTWVSGDNATIQPSVYGTKGISSPANKPGARVYSLSWSDTINGNLWLFGGTYDQARNDLWRYNIATNVWTWMSGDNILGQPGVYGTKGVPSVDNKPPSGAFGESWIDRSGKLWLFSAKYRGNDLWNYNPVTNEWTWVSGDNIADQLGIFGTKGVPSANNKPSGRQGTVGWIGADGKLWLFGGFGVAFNIGLDYPGEPSSGYLNDLWNYTPQPSTAPLLMTARFTGDNASVCAGSEIPVSFVGNHLFNVDNVFTAYFYSALPGGSANKIAIGSIKSRDFGMRIPVTIPANTPAGTYTIQVASSSPAVEGMGASLIVRALPTARITVSGDVSSGGSTVSSSGLSFKYYEGSWARLPDFGGLTPVATGSIANVSLSPRKRDEQFAFFFEGSITIPKAGTYYFETSSDDGSRLYIGNYGHYITPVVDNDGQHGLQTRGGWYTFKEAGRYDIAISYFEQGGDEQLKVYWGSGDAGIPMHTPIPDHAFGPPASVASTLTYQYYEGSWTTLPDFGGLKPVETGHVTTIDLSHRKRDEQFAFLFQGKITVPKAGRYYFETESDDGSRLYIGNYGHYITLVVDNDGQHGLQTRGGWYSFPSAGQYDIAVSFFEQGGDQQLRVYWGSEDAGIPMHTPIPESAFRQGAANACAGSTLTASEADTYLWTTGETTRSIVARQTGNYSVTITKDGCSATATTTVNCEAVAPTVKKGSPSLAPTALSADLSLAASPNPSTSQFTLRISGVSPGSNATLIISDVLGRVVEQKNISADGQFTLGAAYHTGLYHLKLVQGKESRTIKVIKTGK